jgi:hypothetical protein
VGSGEIAVRGCLLGAPLVPPPLVYETAMRDHEHPGSKTGLSALESAQTSGDVEVDLSGQVLRVGGAPSTKEANERSGEIAYEQLPRPLRSFSSGGQDTRESGVGSHP